MMMMMILYHTIAAVTSCSNQPYHDIKTDIIAIGVSLRAPYRIKILICNAVSTDFNQKLCHVSCSLVDGWTGFTGSFYPL